VGSPDAILPPGFIDIDGNGRDLNPRQKYLWENFEARLADIKRDYPIDLIVPLGDLIDGNPNRRDPLGDSCLPRREDQRNAAIMVLRDIQDQLPDAKWDKFVFGTPNHETAEDVRIISKLFTEQKPDWTYRMRVGNAYLTFSHEIGYSGGITSRSGALEREAVNSLLAFAEGNDVKYAAHIRAHAHYHMALFNREQLVVIAPCFQIQNPFQVKSGPFKTFPSLGFLVVHVDDSLMGLGQNPVGFTKYGFPHPPYEIHEPLKEPAVVQIT
jgi:hypothetical protein